MVSTEEKLRLKLRNIAETNSQEGVIIDFEDIDVMSASVADEFIAKLVKELGATSFFGKISAERAFKICRENN